VGRSSGRGRGINTLPRFLFPTIPTPAAMVTLRNSLQVARDPQKADSKETTNVEVLGHGGGRLAGRDQRACVCGPKELASLEAVNVPTIKNGAPTCAGRWISGWWGLISRPLFLWLKWTYKHILSQLGMGDCDSDAESSRWRCCR